MPPKRAAEAGPSRAKKSRPSSDATDAANDNGTDSANAADAPIPRNRRWAAVSGSGNADDAYKRATRNPLTAYNFVCMCQAPFEDDDDDDEDEDDEDDEDDKDNEENGGDGEPASGDPEKPGQPAKRVACDGGKKCLCDKPASDHPDHPWKFSFAGKRKYLTQINLFELRCPDYFGMYTFNDHAGYGVLEMLQNLVLDFEEAAGNYKEQWAVCEGLAFFLATGIAGAVNG
jgi:hypothetical protein